MSENTADAADCLPADVPYRAVGVLGRGSSAVVHRAVHVVHGGHAAVKVFPEGVGESVRQSFATETSLQWRLSDHPNVVRLLHASALDTTRPWIVMELYDRSLDVVLQDRTCHAPADLRRWGLDLVRGLAAVHGEGRLHRDVKPSNVLVKDGTAALSDFGSSLVVGQTCEHVAGTPRYLAPEVLAGGSASTRSDVFAAAITLQRLWQDVAPPAVAGLLDRAASYDPGDRPSDAVELLAGLEALLSAPAGNAPPLMAGATARTAGASLLAAAPPPGPPAPVPAPLQGPVWPGPAVTGFLAGALLVALTGLVGAYGAGPLVSLPMWAAQKATAPGDDRQDVAVPDMLVPLPPAGPTTAPVPSEAGPPTPTASPTTEANQRRTRTTSSRPAAERRTSRTTSSPGTGVSPSSSRTTEAVPAPVELERYTPDREEELSTAQDGKETDISFVNDSNQRVQVYFLHPAGRQLYEELDPGDTFTVLTRERHAFLVADQNQQGLFIVTAVDTPGRVTLT